MFFFSLSGFHHNQFVYWVNVSLLKLPLVTYTPEVTSCATISAQLLHLIFKSHLKTQILIWQPLQELLLSSGPAYQFYYWADLTTTWPSTTPGNAGSPVQKMPCKESSSSLVVPEESRFSPSLNEALWVSGGTLPIAGGSQIHSRGELLREYQGRKQGLWLVTISS